jgi:Fe(II)/alpha-ketoglutarate-dependent arginine beta-hydroxylase
VLRVDLSNDIDGINAVIGELTQRYDSVESPDFQWEARVYAEELPRRVRAALNEYRAGEEHGALLLTGWPIADDRIGPTPEHWANKPVPSTSLPDDVFFFLLACLLGEPIGWATQQDGYIMHDIIPIKGHEQEQIGSGSEVTLTWHTEDAYHPLRTDYLGLMCLRNPDAVETTMADLANVVVDEATRKVLADERFHILPDHSHRLTNQGGTQTAEEAKIAALRALSYERVRDALESPEPVAVLFGGPDTPYLRLDPYFMDENSHGEAERTALAAIGAAIDRAMKGIALQPGDIVFIDNYRMVHGRKPFRARHDGNDRWLRRLNVARDLRKSRAARPSARSRVIY